MTMTQHTREFGFNPHMARSLRRGRTDKIGLLLNSSITYMTDYLADVMTGAALAAEPYGINLVLYTSTITSNDALSQICRAQEIDGAILIWSAGIDATIQTLTRENIPFVVLGRRVDQPGVSYIVPDNFGGAKSATRHLISMGHRRIGFLTRVEYGATNTDRLAGYCAALSDEGISIDEDFILPTRIEPDSGYHAMHLLLDRPNPPTAVLAFDDSVAMDALRAAMDRGCNVPEDIAIVGFDGLRTTMISKPGITTVSIPLNEMGAKAIELLLRLIANPDTAPEQHTVPVSLIIRASTVGE